MESSARLTQRAKQVAELVALGLTNREIAQRLFLSERTIEWHVEQIMNRLGFTSRSQIAAWIARVDSGSSVRVPGAKVRGNLPAPLTSFVGRQPDLAAAGQLVAAHRLVTVTGPGGAGKTRLALKLAEQLQPGYADGAWVCDLAPLADPALVADALVQALGLSSGNADRLAAVRDHLHDQTTLLVLDNCEHLLTAAAGIARDLLAASPGLRMMATSREALGVIGEAVWRLGPLPQDEAVTLFTQRAEAADPGFRLEASNAEAVANVCRGLDCIPLALELVAPRLRVLSAHQIAEVMLDPAWYSRSGERHSSPEAVTEWSYRLLEPEEQILFRHLGTFAGWFEVVDATAVAPQLPSLPTLLAGLVERSMVVADRDAQGDSRYRLLEMLKAFARNRLAEAEELDAARLRHADRMVWLAERLGLLYTEDDLGIKKKLMAMVDDVRTALRTLLELEPRRAAWLAGSLRGFWSIAGRHHEGIRWTTLALEANPETSMERSWLLSTHTILLVRVGRSAEAEQSHEDPTVLATRPENAAMLGHLFHSAGLFYSEIDDHETAEEVFRRSVAEFASHGDEARASIVLNSLACELLHEGRFRNALEVIQRCVNNYRVLGLSELFYPLETLAQTHALLGSADEARKCWLEVAALGGGDIYPMEAAFLLVGLAWAAGMRRRVETALVLHSCGDHLLKQAGISNTEPLAPRIQELIHRLQVELGAEAAGRLQAQGEELSIEEALALAEAEG